MKTKNIHETVTEHWDFIRTLLETHGEDEETIRKIGFHYQTAFLHGFKHGVESVER